MQVALTAVAGEDSAETAMVLSSALHSLRAQILLRQGQRAEALGICRQLAELSIDMNVVSTKLWHNCMARQ